MKSGFLSVLPGTRLLTWPAPSLRTPSLWTPSGLTPKKKARRRSWKVSMSRTTWSSLSMLSRSATVARMAAGTPVVGDDAEVNRVRRVPDQHLGPLLRGPAVHRLVLPEAGEPGGLGPDRLVEHAVDPDRRLQPGDLGGGRALPLDDGTGYGGLEQQQQREHEGIYAAPSERVSPGSGVGRYSNTVDPERSEGGHAGMVPFTSFSVT